MHRPRYRASQRSSHDAIVTRPGVDRRPSAGQFRRNLQYVSLLAIQAGTIYRACVPNVEQTKSYCVIVDRSKPLDKSVRFSGYKPNTTLASGTD